MRDVMDNNKETKMKSVIVYGASDDCIEVDGAIHEEFNPHSNDKADYLAFSDGTVLSVSYGKDGIWHISRIHAGTALYDRTESTDPEGEYSDHVTLTGDISWCVFGSRIERAS